MSRTTAPPSLVAETFGPSRLHIPKAPGLGLLLEQPLFGAYSDRIVRNNQKLSSKCVENRKEVETLKAKVAAAEEGKEDSKDVEKINKLEKQIQMDEDSIRGKVDYKDYEQEMQGFKQTFIYDRMCKVEEDTDE